MKLSVQNREITGKKVKHLRGQDIIPASVFGPGFEPRNVQVNRKELAKIFKEASYNKFIDLELEGDKVFKALIKDVQIHPVRDYFISAAFYKVDESRKISVDVPINYVGTSPAEKNKLGFVVYQFDTINLYCLPKDLPNSVEVDLSTLTEGGSVITAADLKLPEGVEFDSNVGDPSASALVYVATAQKTVETDEESAEEEGNSEESKEEESAE
ncbi:MAG: 50S ribosomal protein L25 [Candidatus Dojkabacteria bacterium]|nr:50S ribosomal protein L25 [Candidatus Dojkabacteria bacterium]MDQ7020389.1 50S ribosomal protein L25 [Candidatus Dojkabacteria bacterium]